MTTKEYDLKIKQAVEWATQVQRQCEICRRYGTVGDPVEYVPAVGDQDGGVDIPGGYAHEECYENKLGSW